MKRRMGVVFALLAKMFTPGAAHSGEGKQKILRVWTVLLFFSGATPVFAGEPLADAVNALQVCAGQESEVVVWDADGDERIFLPEAIHALEAAAGLRDLSKEDPLFPFQWHLRNAGQKTFSPVCGKPGEDMRMAGAMAEGLAGTDVIVAVVDSGLEIAHEDIKDNIIVGGSWNFTNSTTDPTHSSQVKGDHGTSVAGIIAAVAGNGRGGRGVAPNAKLKGFNFLADDAESADANEIASLGGSDVNPNAKDVHIFNMSYGTDGTTYSPLGQTGNEFFDTTSELRSGKGAIYVKSSGNGYDSFEGENGGGYYCCREDASYPPEIRSLDVGCQNAVGEEVNSRAELIVVGAFNANGFKSSYSTPGSVLWISAPGGEFGDDYPAIVTMDQSGCDKGYSRSRNLYSVDRPPANDFQTGEAENSGRHNPNCNYTSSFNGTSSAAPNVSGAIALILDVNSNLTVRELKYILARTARKIDPAISARTVQIGEKSYTLEQPWIVNAAGFNFHNWYGFGAVNVDAAVALARNWTNPLGARQVKTYGGGALEPPVPIPDADADGITRSLTIGDGDNLTIENLVVHVKVDHPNTGETALELTSPSGTKSILLNLRSALKSGMKDGDGATLGSNAFYGEMSKGQWTLRIVDGVPGNTGTLGSFKITIAGY